MSLSAGPGQPISPRCGACKKRVRTDENSRLGYRLQLTGARRKRSNGHRGGAGRSDTQYEYGYQCLECGHVGWSRHIQLKQRWEIDRAKKAV